MELVNRFEVPVGLDRAWPRLLDMETVAACFPGATLATSGGGEYTGTVKVKLGPIQLTYAGAARIVAVDEAAHTATIEASGNAPRSGSTAAMSVVATATSVDDSRTAVVMKTELDITGRPAQFGRGVMVEVGNRILDKFASCLSTTLAGLPDGDARETPSADGAPTGVAEPTHAADAISEGTGSARRPAVGEDSLDLLESARGLMVKRLLPVVLGMVVLWLLCGHRRNRSSL